MKVYIVHPEGEMEQVCWTRQDAEEEAEGTAEITEAELDPLFYLVSRYFTHRGYRFPNRQQAFLFLVSEIGELADRLVQAQSEEWVRNNPENKHGNIGPEQADVLMMLSAMTMVDDMCPIALMVNKFEEKGYDPGSTSKEG